MLATPKFKNKIIQCSDYDSPFEFTAGEQGYFWAKGLGLATTKRCPRCRKVRRATLIKDYSGQGRW